MDRVFSVLKHQYSFKWQDIKPYNGYPSSFDYHVHHHPIDEKNTNKWDDLIDYTNNETIKKTYNDVSVDLSKKISMISDDKYDLQYIKKHDSYNVVDKTNGLVVCLKYYKKRNIFDIATCFFPKKIYDFLSVKDKVKIEKQHHDFNRMDFMFNVNNKDYNVTTLKAFEKAMSEYFGNESIEYRILFDELCNNDDVNNKVVSIKNNINSYLDTMDNLIKDEDDKNYYFVYEDGIEHVVNWSVLYKLKDKDYYNIYNRILTIDINNSYKDAMDECKKFIDESEK